MEIAQQVIVPALVAAIVAFMVEFAAKPSLEARKERILRRHRRLWDLHRLLVQHFFLLGQIEVALAEDYPAPERRESLLRKSEDHLQLLDDYVHDPSLPVPEEVQELLRTIAFVSEIVVTASRQGRLEVARERNRALDDALDLADAYLEAPRWRVIKRRRIRRDVLAKPTSERLGEW